MFLLLIGYRYAQLRTLPSLRRFELLQNIRGQNRDTLPEVFDDLRECFRRAQTRLITQHIVLESWRRGRELDCFGDKTRFWDAMVEIMIDPGIEELPVEICIMNGDPTYRKMMRAIGPADAGLIYAASRRNATILTEDATLRQFAYTHAECFSLAEIH